MFYGEKNEVGDSNQDGSETLWVSVAEKAPKERQETEGFLGGVKRRREIPSLSARIKNTPLYAGYFYARRGERANCFARVSDSNDTYLSVGREHVPLSRAERESVVRQIFATAKI